MATLPFKRGDTYLQECVVTEQLAGQPAMPVDLTNVVITSQIRSGEELLATCVVTKTNAAEGRYTIEVAANLTALWPAKELSSDIQYVINGQTISTETFAINVVKDQTRE